MSSDFVIVNSAPSIERALDLPARPQARCSVAVRAGIASDAPFIDRLQKMHSHMVGWMPAKQLEEKIAAGHVLIAEERHEGTGAQRHEGNDGKAGASSFVPPCLSASVPAPLGYCIAQDQYMGRDDVGVIFQLNVLPLKQRHLIGATLIKATFDRAAYGCRLYCCWCAQDIGANFFWESIGFVPLAFRTGSRAKQRTHIFWQRRIREDDKVTPYWFPAQTKSGAIREDRIVLPIPLDTHWRDAKPIILPGLGAVEGPGTELPKALPGGALVRPRPEQPKTTVAHRMAVMRSQSKHLGGTPAGKAAVITSNGLRYIERGDHVPEVEPPKPKRIPKPRAKNDPKLVAAVRELRDRYLEQVNAPGVKLMTDAKYEVSRSTGGAVPQERSRFLPAA